MAISIAKRTHVGALARIRPTVPRGGWKIRPASIDRPSSPRTIMDLTVLVTRTVERGSVWGIKTWGVGCENIGHAESRGGPIC